MSVAPDIASLLAPHMGGGLAQAPPPGPPAQPGSLQGQPQSNAHPVALIRQMIAAGQQYLSVEKDPERKATMAKVIATLHQYEADEQKQQDAALGVSPAMKAMRQSSRGY